MRACWLFLVGISLLACKDKDSSQPAARPIGSAAPVHHPPAVPKPQPAAPPTLDFEHEPQDKAWSDATEKAIHAVAPELTNVTCRQTQCRATLTGASPMDAARLVDKLQEPDALPSTEARNILLDAPVTKDGKTSITMTIRYDRDD